MNLASTVYRSSLSAFRDLLHYVRCGHETESSGDEGRRTEARIAIQLQRFAIAGGLSLRAHRAVAPRKNGRLRRIDGIYAEFGFAAREAKMFAQLVADLLQKTIVRGMRQIRDTDGGRITPPPRAATSHDRCPFFATVCNQSALVCKAVDGIDDKVISGAEQRLGVGFCKIFRDRMCVALGINVADTLGHDFDFGPAYVCIQRMQLPIDIADTDFIKIDQCQLAKAGARERLDRPRSNAADTDDANVCGPQTLEGAGSKEPADATETKIEVAHPRAIYHGSGRLSHSQRRRLWYKDAVQAMLKVWLPLVALSSWAAQAQVVSSSDTKNSVRHMDTNTVSVSGAAKDAATAANRQVATLAGGCFWGMEEILRKIPGVLDTRVGYTGGTVPNPTYRLVCTGITGHAEAVEIGFDPAKISYEELLGYFFRMHDPTTLNQQHNDRGTQYRSAIFYHNDEQKQAAQRVKERVDKSGKWKRPIVTEITKATEFWPAEDYHQKYLVKNPGGYNCHFLRD